MPPATALLYHRLTSLEPGREDDSDPFVRGWVTPGDHPLLVHGFAPNAIDDGPRRARPTRRGCRPSRSRATGRRAPRRPPPSSPAGTRRRGRRWTSPPSLGSCICRPGVVRVLEREDRPRLLFRTAGSAGGRFPFELYVAAKRVSGLEDGVYWYDPVGHALRGIGPAADGEATALVLTGVPWRSAWRYAERSLRHLYWDAGTMLAQTLALTESGGLAPRLWTRFPDADLTRLVGADGVHELPLALLGWKTARPPPDRAARRPRARSTPRRSSFP